MTRYALVSRAGDLLSFKDLDQKPPTKGQLHPDKPYYLPVDDAPRPPLTDTQRASSAWQVMTLKVKRVWTVEEIPAAEIDAGKDAEALGLADQVQFKILFDQENRLRALEGKTAVTAAQFKNAVKGLL